MDTHIAPPPDFDHHEIVETARLFGEPDPDAHLSLVDERLENPAIPAALRKHRAMFLGGATVAGVVVIAFAAVMLSDNNQVVPLPARVASTVRQTANGGDLKLDGPLAPSASLASVAVPGRPKVVVLQKYIPKPHNQDLSDILGMRPSEEALQGQNSSLFAPHEPGSAPAPPKYPPAFVATKTPGHDGSSDITQSIIAAVALQSPKLLASPLANSHSPLQSSGAVPRATPKAAPAPQLVALPPPPMADALKQPLYLQAAPMAAGDQIRVLELVTQMATMVRDLKAQNANLRADFAKTSADDQAHLADFARRMDFAEASKAVAAASRAGDPGQVSDESHGSRASMQPAMASTPIAVTRPEAALPSSAPQEAKHYRVQAASPGLALLTEVARGGGDGAQLQVTVGEAIPGWGRVKSVGQRGTSWVVNTEKGVID